MVDFTIWDILRNLLLAIRWTVVLSLIAFVGGGLVGLLLLVLRSSGKPMLQRLVAGYVQLFQGTPLLMHLFLAYFGLALLGFETSAGLPPVRRSRCTAAPSSPKSGTAACAPFRAASGKRRKAWP